MTTPAAALRARRTQALLHGRILPTILRLSTPNVLGLAASTAIIAWDGYIIGLLGSEALAGAALVFPISMLMLQMSNGALGGSINAVIARALGAADNDSAERLSQHAVVVAATMSALFTLVMLGLGTQIFKAMGAHNNTLSIALTYSNTLFLGASSIWLTSTLSAIVRGCGNMTMPSLMLILTAVLHLGLCPALVFGWGPLPAIGIAGAALSTITVNAIASGCMAYYLMREQSPLRLRFRNRALQSKLFKVIMRIGLPGAISPVLSNGSILMATAYIGSFGTLALAGYGVASRLEFILVPIVFGVGTVLTTMVATNIGAGNTERALRATWTGSLLVTGVTLTLGTTVALFPMLWMQWFTTDPEIIRFGSNYLHIVGPCYGFFGLGLVLFFASQGSGKLFWPLIGSSSRLVFVALGGWVALTLFTPDPRNMFIVVAIGFALYATITTVSILVSRWGAQRS